MKDMKNTIALIIALVLGVVAVFAIRSFVIQKEEAIKGELVKVLVATRDLEVGERLRYGDMAEADIPRKAWTTQHSSPEDRTLLTGQLVKYTIKEGEPILHSCLEGVVDVGILDKIEVGMRTVTVSVTETSSVAGMIEPGDLVDIFLTYTPAHFAEEALRREGQPRMVPVTKTIPLMSRVKVIAVGQRIFPGGAEERERGYSTVTLAVEPQAAALLIHAQGQGQLVLSLRNPTDTTTLSEIVPVDSVGFEDMVEAMEKR